MGFIKGPKQLLSSAIVNALDKFFIVDSTQIESKLLGDARIVLKNVALRPIEDSTVVKKNTTGESSTVLSVTGVVEEVIFSWRWTTEKTSKSWVEDVNLTIKGATFRIKLEHGSITADKKNDDVTSSSSSLDSSSDILPDEKIIADTTKTEAKRVGGIRLYVRRHIEAMLDALTLRLDNFKIVFEVPNNEGGTTMVAFGGESVVIESHGRDHKGLDGDDQGEDFESMSNLRQTLSLLGLYGSIVGNVEKTEGIEIELKEDFLRYGDASNPLLEPFSCTADIIRSGKRFGNFKRGLRAVFRSGPTGLVLHAGHVQSYALAQFSTMLLSAKDNDGTEATEVSNPPKKTEEKVTTAAGPVAPPSSVVPPAQAFPSKRPTVFDFELVTVAVVFDKRRVQVSNFSLTYIADGSKLAFEAEQFSMGVGYDEIGGDDGEFLVLVKGIRGSKSPELKVDIDIVERIEMPRVRLLSPVKDTHLAFEGNALVMKIQRLQLSFLSRTQPKQQNESPNEHRNIQAPFHIDLSVKELGLQHNDNPNSRMQLDGVQLLANPTHEGTEVAAYVDLFQRNVMRKDAFSLKVFDIIACARWPMVGFKLIENLHVSAKKVDVREIEWTNVFDLDTDKNNILLLKGTESNNTDESHALVPQKQRGSTVLELMKDSAETMKNKSKAVESTTRNSIESMKKTPGNSIVKKVPDRSVWILSNAQIDALKIYLSIKISRLGSASVKDFAFTAKPFKGNDKTTGKHLIDYYMTGCLKHLPELALKTEFNGVNALDIGTNTYGAFLGMTTPFGAIASPMVMVGADAIKGAVAAGKKARSADNADSIRPMDFFRGIGYAAADASRKGALRLGGDKGGGLNIIHWAVGVSMDTSEYVEENKARLGGAGGAGAGMVVGFMFGGPMGGIVGGVIGGVATQKTIEKIDEKSKKN